MDEKIIDSKHYQDNLFTKSSDITVPQFDGGNDENTNKISTKKVYAVNCEIKEISVVINFMTSCTFLWRLSCGHEMCEYNSKHK